MKNISLVWLIGLSLLFISDGVLSATAQRAKLKTPPVKIYQSMLRFADKGDYGKIEASLTFIKPIILPIKKKWKINMEREIRESVGKQDKTVVLLSIQKLIFLDMESLMYTSIDKELPDKKRGVQIRTAYLNYLLLSPTIKKKKFLADQRVKKAFRRLHASVETSPYARSVPGVNFTAMENQIHAIEEEMIKLFPKWKLQKLLRKEEEKDVDSEKREKI